MKSFTREPRQTGKKLANKRWDANGTVPPVSQKLFVNDMAEKMSIDKRVPNAPFYSRVPL